MKREYREATAANAKAKPQPTAPGIQALEATRLKIAQHIAAQRTPGAQRVDNSPYRKESRE